MSDKKEQRLQADQGDIFYADLRDAKGRSIAHPIFILGKNNDSNDFLDVLACQCTTKPSASPYDYPVQLKHHSYIRTNKIYTVQRELLEFQIPHSLQSDEIDQIIHLAISAISKKEEQSLVTTAIE